MMPFVPIIGLQHTQSKTPPFFDSAPRCPSSFLPSSSRVRVSLNQSKMPYFPAFTGPAFLGSSSFSSTRSHVSQRKPMTGSTAQRITMTSPLPDFDDIAKQLQKELQIRRSATPEDSDLPKMPSPDAPAEEQPFEITTGNNNMPKVIMRHVPSSQQVEVYTYGAAVTSWTTRGEDHFWLSDTNKWELGGKAIRGGIPICFPQFGPYGDLVQHGFARVSDWMIKSTTVNDDGSVSAVFALDHVMGQDPVSKWPYKFEAEYMVMLSFAGLETKLTVTNKDDKPFSFTCAFHNYFKTTDVKDARIFGFENKKWLNRLENDKEMGPQEDTGAGILLTEETDRIYLDVPEELAVFDFASLKVLKIKKTPTLQETTLWNPYGAEGADPGWKQFVCIEPACVKNPAVLQPGESWVGAQLLGVE